MKKYLVLSFDDGTKADERVIEILNKYNLRGTFNLNSGLLDYKYELEGKLIERIDLYKNKDIYNGHEVASHTLTHSNIFKLAEADALNEVVADIKNLEEIFNKPITSIGIPYSDYDEDRIELIKKNTNLKCFRFPRVKALGENELDKDQFHVAKNGVYDDIDIYDKLNSFIEYEGDSIFILLADPYKIDAYNKWDYFENLIRYISEAKGIEVKPMTEACQLIYNFK